MPNNFDTFPIYDALIKRDTNQMSDIWVSAMATFIQTLQDYINENGFFVPRITLDERNAAQTVINGQLIYNSTSNKFQGYANGSWVDLH